LLPRSLRGRLAVAISLITTLVVAGSFFAIHQGTGSELQRRIDSDLSEQFGEFQQQSLGDVKSSAALERAARRFISSQRYHPESRIFLIDVKGGADVTNQRDVVEREVEAESTEAGERERESTLLDARTGFTNVSTEDAGRLRVYSRPIIAGSRELGTFRVADPRVPIERAQSGLRRTFLIVGVLALVVSAAVAIWVATLITRPLRRMVSVASEVDAGELTHRLGRVGSGSEVTSLADSFDHMLDRLEGAFRRQREFVSDASHELRTPLTVLRGQIELLGREEDDEMKRRQMIETSIREIDHMNRLIDDMLLLARAEAGGLVDRREVDLSDFLHDLERDLPLFGERDYRVEGPREGIVIADPDRLSQVVRNLVRNAVNHTAVGQPITVTATPRGDSLQFSITDSGAGIPEDQLERVFDRFYRTDSGRSRDEGGSGLGLAIARALVEAHGGRIWAEASLAKGARISFELPGYRRPIRK
jgi:heavy metal sensor kinase